MNNPYQNNNNHNNDEKKYYNITPSQNDNQNECSQFKNSQQVSTNPSKNSTLNSISYNICEVEHYSKESQIGSSSKINIKAKEHLLNLGYLACFLNFFLWLVADLSFVQVRNYHFLYRYID